MLNCIIHLDYIVQEITELPPGNKSIVLAVKLR